MRFDVLRVDLEGFLRVSHSFADMLRLGLDLRQPLPDDRRTRIQLERLLVSVDRLRGQFGAARHFVLLLERVAQREVVVEVGLGRLGRRLPGACLPVASCDLEAGDCGDEFSWAQTDGALQNTAKTVMFRIVFMTGRKTPLLYTGMRGSKISPAPGSRKERTPMRRSRSVSGCLLGECFGTMFDFVFVKSPFYDFALRGM